MSLYYLKAQVPLTLMKQWPTLLVYNCSRTTGFTLNKWNYDCFQNVNRQVTVCNKRWMDECCLTTRVIKEVCKRAKNKYFQHMIRVDVMFGCKQIKSNRYLKNESNRYTSITTGYIMVLVINDLTLSVKEGVLSSTLSIHFDGILTEISINWLL